MRAIRVFAIVLIIAGILGLAYDGCSYTKESHGFNIGSLEIAVKDKETINIPLWCSVGAIAAGALLLLSRRSGSVF